MAEFLVVSEQALLVTAGRDANSLVLSRFRAGFAGFGRCPVSMSLDASLTPFSRLAVHAVFIILAECSLGLLVWGALHLNSVGACCTCLRMSGCWVCSGWLVPYLGSDNRWFKARSVSPKS